MKMIRNIKIYRFLPIALGSIIAFGCAKDVSPSNNELNKEYLEKWVQKNYPDAKIAGNGIYILEETAGNGKTYNGEPFARISSTTSSLSGEIVATTYEGIAKQLGIYNESHYYGPQTWNMDIEYMPVGLYDMIYGMKKGERRKALIPSWLMGYKRYKKASEYIKKNPKDAVTTIYDIKLEDFTEDMLKYQTDSIERYIARTYPGLDSTKTGFYYKQLKAPSSPVTEKDTTIYINYTGRLLNGQVFDTTIEDTAKTYRVYNPKKSYKPVGVNRTRNYQDISFSGSEKSSLIPGFQLLLSKMGANEKAVAIFVSDYGYGARSSGKTIPAYSPLLFEVQLTDKPSK